MKVNQTWVMQNREHKLGPYIFKDVNVYAADRLDSSREILLATIDELSIDTMYRGAMPIMSLSMSEYIPYRTKFSGTAWGIKWREASGPSRAYYNGIGWWVTDLRFKWKDGEGQASFRSRGHIGFLNGEQHDNYTTGHVGDLKLYSLLESEKG